VVKVSRETFHEMLKNGFINTGKWSKNYTITGKRKGKSARKHYFVVEPDYVRYLRIKNVKSRKVAEPNEEGNR